MKTKRIAPGEYEVSHGEYVVSVIKLEDWEIRPRWDHSRTVEGVRFPTLRDAKRRAGQIIDETIMDELKQLTNSNAERFQKIRLGTHA